MFTVQKKTLLSMGLALCMAQSVSAQTLEETVADLSGFVRDNATEIATNAEDISNLTARVNTMNTQLTSQATQVSNNTTAIDSLNSTVSDLSGFVRDNATEIATNAEDISNLTGRVNTMNSQMTTQATQVSNNTTAIDSLSDTVSDLSGFVRDNATEIATNAEDISNLGTDIAHLEKTVYGAGDSINNLNASNGSTITSADASVVQNINTLAEHTDALERSIMGAQIAVGDTNFNNTHYLKGSVDLSDAMRTLDSEMYDLQHRVDRLETEVYRGLSSVAALSGLVPNAKASGNTQIAVGTGGYRHYAGVAIGAFHYLDDNVLLNAGVAHAGSKSTTWRAGMTLAF